MSKTLILILWVLLFPIVVTAYDLAGGIHDRTGDPAFLAAGLPGLCAQCHVPHGAFELELWEWDLVPDATDVEDLCLDCHGGSPPTWASTAVDVSDVDGSLHDFEARPIGSRGSCTACHSLHDPSDANAAYAGSNSGHYFVDYLLWDRDITGELLNIFEQKRFLSRSSANDGPNYIIGKTIFCYDCHGGEGRVGAPTDGDFDPLKLPQDIAFGGDRGVAGGTPGYYELPSGEEPNGTTPAPTLSDVLNNPDDPGSIPGGHYIRSPMNTDGVQINDNYEVRDPDDTLLYRISIGDKLPCELCHNPHLKVSDVSGSPPDEVFFRRDIHTGEGVVVDRSSEIYFSERLDASEYTRNGSGDGRKMCIYCHGTSDWDETQNPGPTGGISPLIVDWTDRTTLFGIQVRTGITPDGSDVFPPPDFVYHTKDNTQPPCTECHQHNEVYTVKCDECHGYPPTSANNRHATGVSPVNHDAAGIVPNHGECWYCHGVSNDGSDKPSVMGTDVLKGSYIYSWSADHQDGQTTMNGDGAANGPEDDAGYTAANGGCSTAGCHLNDAGHRLAVGSGPVNLRDLGPGVCTDCHGTDDVRFYPDGGAQNGTAWPNRPGKHADHVQAIANLNSVSTSSAQTCVWCHPGGAHSGDQASAPADLHDGSASHFMDIIGNADSGEAIAQSPSAATVSCSGVNCHYNKTPPVTQWYGTATGGCDYCHTYAGEYVPGALPNAHDVHVDAWADGGYGMSGIFCLDCHQATGQYMPFGGRHQNGIAEVTFAYLANNNPTDGNESAIAGTGSLAGAVKYGGGTYTDYISCAGIYCHGDFDDQAGLGGGNASNTPNWFNTTADGACGTCHGDPDAAGVNLKAAPVTGNSGTLHPNHLDLDTAPAMNCSVCHRDGAVPSANGTYGDYMRHVDGQILMALNHRTPASSFLIADFEFSTSALAGSYGSYTCSNIKCHNGVATPVWSDASLPGFGCGDCHNEGAGVSPLPTWYANVTGSHAAHADTDADYTDCARCHGVAAANYSATGGTGHQDLVVGLSLPGTGATYSDSSQGGVNHSQVTGPGDRIDNGLCSNVSCHGTGTPQWGAAGPIACGTCHGMTVGAEDRVSWGLTPDVQGAPPLTSAGDTNRYAVGKHEAHVDNSGDLTGDACDLCHLGAGSGSGDHGDLQTDVVFHSAAGTSAVYDSSTTPPTCSNLSVNCHGPGVWDEKGTGGCDFCHGGGGTGQYWPDGVGGSTEYVDDEPGSHDSHVAAIGSYLGYGNYTSIMYTESQQKVICAFCHPDPGGTDHKINTAGSSDTQVDVLGDGFAAGTFTAFSAGAQAVTADRNNQGTYDQAAKTCSNVDCHYEKTTPAYAGSGWDGGDTGTPDCETCHFYRDGVTYPTSAYMSGALPDAHQAHVAGIAPPDDAQSQGYPCSYCHDVTGYTTAHTNGEIDLSDAGSPNQDVDGDAGDEAITPSSTAVKYGLGTADTSCTNMYCHGADFSTETQGTDVTPVWNDHMSAVCADCHDVDVMATGHDIGQTFTEGRHQIHIDPGVQILNGPRLYRFTDGTWDHADSCTFCHGIRDPQGGSFAGCNATNCHSGGAFSMPSASDEGWVTFPSASHVSGNFEIDFENQDRGWDYNGDYTGSGTVAVMGTTNATGTDICNRCHSTATVSGAIGADLAKQYWGSASYSIPCLNCHNGTNNAMSHPVSGGVAATAKDAYYEADNGGHGYDGTHTGTGNPGAGMQCDACHNENSLHMQYFPDSPINSDRLGTVFTPETICADCHVPGQSSPGALGIDATVEATDHSTSVTGRYSSNTAYDYPCITCHDPHGTSNIGMIRATIVDSMGGDATGVTLAAETGLDPSSAADDGVCDRCHDDSAAPHALTAYPGDHNYGDPCVSCHDHAESFYASCTSCHGNEYTGEYYPTSGGPNGSGYPNRRGDHVRHVNAIANVNGYSTTTADTCVWCHPGGVHSGDQSSAPADLHDGLTTEFLNILGNPDGGAMAASAQQSGTTDVSCGSIDCHYETDFPASYWYGGASANCASCHFWTTPYNAGDLPNAHDIHVDEIADGGYDMACTICHPTPALPDHQNGIAEMDFSAMTYADGDEAVAGSGGVVKFGFGTSADYYTCENFYCHGDFDDAGLGGGNVSNTPNWGDSSTGDCGTCHGDIGGATESLKAAPIAGDSGSVHVNHVSMATTTPSVTCTVCHFVSWGGATNGSYGNKQVHADGTLQPINLNNRYSDSPSAIIVDFESSPGNWSTVSGGYTCSNIVCHNGVTTPVWSDTSIPGFTCGDCHQDTNAGSPLPTGDAGVTGSHGAHADTNTVYTDCDKCHGIVSGVYTAVGGTNHQDLVVNLSLPGSGPTYSDTDPAGVNWVAGDGFDDGLCSNVSCHGAGGPQWGAAGSVECGSCHGRTVGAEDRASWGLTPDVQGAPPLTSAGDTNRYAVGKHEAHVDNSGDLTGDACDLCHLGAGSGSGDHGDLQTDVVFQSAAGTSAIYDSSTTPPTCSNLAVSCHGPGVWDEKGIGGCDFCHGYPPASTNNKHAEGVSPVNHDAAGIVANHQECWFCHGLRNDGSNLPSVMGTDVLKGSYIYSWTADHEDGRTTMNGNANADTSDDAGYNATNGGCDTTACHGNDATHRVGSGSAASVNLRDLGPGSCSTCHGTDGVRFYPDSSAQNGTGWPNRIGSHAIHVPDIATRNSLSTANDETCDWCHPGGGHSGDQSAVPADLHDGAATHFKDIIGNADSGEAIAQSPSAATVSCGGVNCHYNKTPPVTGWYGSGSMGCDGCHVAGFPYTPGDLPAAHDLHLDEVADGGYGMGANWGYCMACHITVFNYDHQNGIPEVQFADPFGFFPDDGDATAVSNGGPLSGRVKYGMGTSADYPTCTGIYCHGDFDDGGISGGNAANAPNWWDTTDGGACGTCHGDTGGADQTHQALPVTGSTGTIHANHVDMSPSVEVDCSICHYDPSGTNGTYGNNAVHSNASLQVALQTAASGATLIADYEDNTASLANTTYGAVTCAAVICHNGVTTPVWSDTSVVSCGDCHHDSGGVGSSPLPGWEGSVSRSHSAHADTDADYTDCAVCHLASAANYTATSGTNHQDLVVQIAPSGASYSESLGSAGVNWTSGGDGVDNGTCSVASCHGGGTPIWGDPSSLNCSDCHDSGLGGAPVVTAASTHVDADGSGGTYSAGTCINCHAGHVGRSNTVTIPLPPVSWSNANMTATSMRTQLGINYSAHNGIAIGGSGGQIAASISGLATEAEICWGCHDSLATQVSEWGFNTKTNVTMTGFSTVWAAFPTQGDGTAESKNYGWIYDSTYSSKVTDWTAGHWMSAYDSLIKRRIASMHTANFDVAGQSSSVADNIVSASGLVRQGPDGNPNGDTSDPVLEGVQYIRCSYCHDVHGTFGPSGKPHLRGTWVGDPYPPELPPRNTYTYTNKISTLSGNLPTPRALASSRDRGGYFIDQNSNSPTVHTDMDTIAETAGLCTLCHGTDIDNMDYYSSSSLWRFAPPGSNGHSNSALGGTRDAALINDLFTAARYGHDMGMQSVTPRTPWVCDDYGTCDPNYPQASLVYWSCEMNCQNILNSGWFNTIRTGTSFPKGGDFTNWYGINTIGGINQAGAKAHNFTCSKCHSPHATGLPALLTMNCIDPSLGNFTVNGYTGTNLIANNCHRKTSTSDGWHILAPGQ